MTKEIEQWWDEASPSFQKQAKHPTNDAVYGPWVPNESKLKLLGKLKNKKILEIGCGGAQCSIYFAKKGAICTAVDSSKKQLEYAQKLIDKEKVNVKLIQNDIQTLSYIKSNSFDIVFSSWAFQYIPDLTKCFKDVKRVLVKNGIFVFSFDHPFYRIFDDNSHKLTRSYHKAGKFSEPEKWNDVKKHKFVQYDRRISDIFQSLKINGFEVVDMLEEVDLNKNEPLKRLFPKKIVKFVPTTIIFKAKK